MIAHLTWQVIDRERVGAGRPVSTNTLPLAREADSVDCLLPLEEVLPMEFDIGSATTVNKRGRGLILGSPVVVNNGRGVQVRVGTDAATSLGLHVVGLLCTLVGGQQVAFNLWLEVTD